MPRMIDADKAIEYLENHKRVAEENNFMLAADEDAIIKFISENCPTIDPESLIPHGRWEIVRIGSFSHYRCSACGSHAGIGRGYNKFSFCPACGARMEEEAEDG